MRVLTQSEVMEAARTLVQRMFSQWENKTLYLFGIPRGGVPAAYALCSALQERGVHAEIVDDSFSANVLVDDIVDSGATAAAWEVCSKPVVTLFKKPYAAMAHVEAAGVTVEGWVVFPWETDAVEDHSSDDVFTRLLQFIGEDPTRGGLVETPARAAKAWQFWTKGYGENPEDVLKVFEDGGERYDQMVCVRNIPVHSHCEHHLAPIFGVAHVAYVPNGRIVGLSKLNRVVDIFARRLQVQERLTDQIAEALDVNLKPKGVAVTLECRHFCVESRGIRHQGSVTVTTALRGLFRDDHAAKQEFFNTIGR